MTKFFLHCVALILSQYLIMDNPSKDRSDYGSYLNDLISNNGLLPDSAVSYIIPRNVNEFELFYSYYANKETYSSFMNIFGQIKRCAYNKEDDCFENYILMYELINPDVLSEEFLEDIFYSIDILIENNTEKFCLFFKELKRENSINLTEFYEMYCE